ncbi:MAG: M28 family peptidase [Ruminococcaceae bacterium]|nr:M28 family peptidase [Oscillospiraceae bacterium]
MEITRKISDVAQKIFEQYPVRFRKKEKEALLEELSGQFAALGYEQSEIKVMTHDGAMTSRNLVVGDPSARYVITAHYDTPGRNGFLLSSAPLIGQTGANIVMLLMFLPLCILEGVVAYSVRAGLISALTGIWLNPALVLLFVAAMIIPMVVRNKTNRNDNTSGVIGVLECAARIAGNPALRSQCCFILFDNEEWGLVGSSSHAEWCKKNKINMKDSLVINLDCIGVGDTLVAARTGKRGEKLKGLLDAMSKDGVKIVEKRSIMVYMSDHANFPNSAMFAYMKHSSLGPLYIPNIHSSKDKECDLALVSGLAQSVVRAIEQQQ